MYASTTSANKAVIEAFRTGNYQIVGGSIAWGQPSPLPPPSSSGLARTIRVPKKKKKCTIFKVKDTDLTTKATRAKRARGPEQQVAKKLASKKAKTTTKKAPKPKKASGGGMLQRASGPGHLSDFRVNGKLVFAKVTWKTSMVLSKEDGLVCDAKLRYAFSKGDSWSIGTMVCASASTVFHL